MERAHLHHTWLMPAINYSQHPLLVARIGDNADAAEVFTVSHDKMVSATHRFPCNKVIGGH